MQRLAAILGIVGGLWAVEEPAEAWAASAESEAAYAQAVERFEDGDVDRGVEALLQSLDLDPANVQARLLLGELRLRQGDLGAAETALTQVLAVEELDASVAIDAATLRAEALLQAGRYDAALQALPD
ncbi:MAG: tetratricopeptide repeat protein [Pseudomonadota bacterium]